MAELNDRHAGEAGVRAACGVAPLRRAGPDEYRALAQSSPARYFAVLCVLLALLLLPASVRSQDGVGTQVTADGVTVSLLVPGTTFPRDALVQATVVVRNSSQAIISVPTSCDSNNPGIELLRHDAATGRDDIRTYPPALPEAPALVCSAVIQHVPPGGILRNSGLIVLRSAYLRAFVDIWTGSGIVHVTTAQIHFHLRRANPPRVTLHTTQRAAVTVHAPAGASGPLLYVQYSACPDPVAGTIGWVDGTWRVWDSSATDRLRPECRRPTAWDALAGWMGFTVARIRYP